MTRLFALLVVASLAVPAFAQEVPKPKAEDKKAEPKKSDEKPPEEEVDVHKTAERIADNAQKAGNRLKEKDPGADTRKIQEEIIKDIDTLIKKAQNSPPPPMSDMSPMNPPPPKNDKKSEGTSPMSPKSPMGSGGTSGSGKPDRRPRRERQPRGQSPMGMNEPMAKGGTGGMNPMPATPQPKDAGNEKPSGEGSGDKFGQASPKRQNDKLTDLYKDLWGHLPDRMRQEMDLYYREKFMPRYSELLRQYYAALAEQRKKGSEDR
jgi:hypothetical protein